jgi:F-type H+-transporting ATPase subunit b
MKRRRFAVILIAFGLGFSSLAFAGEEKGSGAPEANLFWEWANFVVLAGVLGYMAVKQGGPFFRGRAAEIRKGISDAEQIKADSTAKIASVNSKLGRLDVEIASLRETALSERRAAEQRIKAQTVKELDRIQLQAESEIESAGKSERIALQRYAANLALELAEAKVRARMNPDAEDALVQAFVRGLASGVPQPPETSN